MPPVAVTKTEYFIISLARDCNDLSFIVFPNIYYINLLNE